MAKGKINSAGRQQTPKSYVTIIVLALALVITITALYLGLKKEAPSRSANESNLSGAERAIAQATRYMQMRQHNAAVEVLRSHLNDHPDDVAVRLMLAKAYLAMELVNEGEAEIDEVLKLRPGMAEAMWVKGNLLDRRKDPAAGEYYRKAAESQVDPSPLIWSRYGLFLLAGNKISEAEVWFRKAYDAGDEDYVTIRGLGEVEHARGDFKAAVELLGRAVAMNQNDEQAWLLLADAQKNSGRFAAALETLRNAGRFPNTQPDRMLQMGDVLLLQKNIDEAAQWYLKAAEYEKFRSPASLKVAKCCYMQDRFAQAMKYIDIASGITPGDAEVIRWKKIIEDARFGPAKPAGEAE